MDYYALIYSRLSGLRDRGSAGVNVPDGRMTIGLLEFRSRAIEGSAKAGLVVDIDSYYYRYSRLFQCLDSFLRNLNAIQASLNDWLEGGRRRPLYSSCRLLYDKLFCAARREEPSEASIPSYAIVVSAVVLLSLVYQYLTGNVDIDSSKAYSRSSLDFRDIYVAVVLFLGAYVWIKFREVALRGAHKRVVKRGRITKLVYDARLTPPKWNGVAVPKLELGQFATEQEAHKKFRIAAFYYNRDAGLLDGWFQVPPMSEEERSLTGLDKRAWVTSQAKRVYEDFKQKEEAASLLQEYLEVSEGEVDVDFPAERHQPPLVSQAENLGMATAILDDEGLECAPNSFGGMHEGLAVSNGHSLGFEEGFAQLPPITESGMSLNGSDQWDLPETVNSEASVLNSAEHQLPLVVSQAEGIGMSVATQPMLGDQGLVCASQQSFGEMHQEPTFKHFHFGSVVCFHHKRVIFQATGRETSRTWVTLSPYPKLSLTLSLTSFGGSIHDVQGFVTFNGHGLGFQEESAIPVPQLPPDTHSGMGMNNSNQLNLPQIVQNQQELITYLRQQLQERDAQISVLQNEKRLDRQQLEESRNYISLLEFQHFVQQ